MPPLWWVAPPAGSPGCGEWSGQEQLRGLDIGLGLWAGVGNREAKELFRGFVLAAWDAQQGRQAATGPWTCCRLGWL